MEISRGDPGPILARKIAAGVFDRDGGLTRETSDYWDYWWVQQQACS